MVSLGDAAVQSHTCSQGGRASISCRLIGGIDVEWGHGGMWAAICSKFLRKKRIGCIVALGFPMEGLAFGFVRFRGSQLGSFDISSIVIASEMV